MPKRGSNQRKAAIDDSFEDNELKSTFEKLNKFKKSRQTKQESIKDAEENVQAALKPLLETFKEQAEQRQQVFRNFAKDISNLKKEDEKVQENNSEDMLKLKNLAKKKILQVGAARAQNLDSLKKMCDDMLQKFEAAEHIYAEQLAEMKNRSDYIE